jgi:hypothetical protein
MKHGGEPVPVDTADLTRPDEAKRAEPTKEIVSVKNEGGVAKTVARQKFTSGKFNIQPFIDEHEMIQTYLEREWFPSLESRAGADIEFDNLYEELAELNAEIWKLTDQGHVLVLQAKGILLKQEQPPDAVDRLAAECLYGTIEKNTKRAEVVGRINTLFGINVVEKMFP